MMSTEAHTQVPRVWKFPMWSWGHGVTGCRVGGWLWEPLRPICTDGKLRHTAGSYSRVGREESSLDPKVPVHGDRDWAPGKHEFTAGGEEYSEV